MTIRLSVVEFSQLFNGPRTALLLEYALTLATQYVHGTFSVSMLHMQGALATTCNINSCDMQLSECDCPQKGE